MSSWKSEWGHGQRLLPPELEVRTCVWRSCGVDPCFDRLDCRPVVLPWIFRMGCVVCAVAVLYFCVLSSVLSVCRVASDLGSRWLVVCWVCRFVLLVPACPAVVRWCMLSFWCGLLFFCVDRCRVFFVFGDCFHATTTGGTRRERAAHVFKNL